MEEKDNKRKEKVAKAIADKKIIDNTSFTVFQMIEDLNERLDTEIPKITEVLDKVRGDDGKDGVEGRQGLVGDQGENGLDGCDGIDGKDGKDGKDGRNGIDGKDGLKGKDGKDASIEETARMVLETIVIPEETGETIVEKINEGTSIIKKENIEGLADIEKLAKNNAFNPTMGPSFSDLVKKVEGDSENRTTPKLTVSFTEPKNPKLYDLWYDLN